MLKRMRDRLQIEVFKPEKEITVYLPVHIPWLIQIAKQKFTISHHHKSDINPHIIVDSVNELC